MKRQGGGVPTWSVAVHSVCRLCSFLGSTGQVSPDLCFAQDHPAWAKRPSEMVDTCAGLADSQGSQTVNLGWLLLVPCLGLLSKR